ncbi:MAG: glycosyltransferase family 39 protein [Anaeromyxobacter sp.]|nr:glycosyltransferase family 39 protein [Anaeromyxobacter sp.]
MTRPAWLRWLLPALLGLLVLATFRDYGYSWDESWQNRWYGQAVLRFLASLGADRSAVTTNNFYLYGGTFDAAAELLVGLSPLVPRDTRHLANALAGLAGIAGCWALAGRLGGRAAGAWAALFLAACAPWYGHMFINAKDIPFAAATTWALVLCLRWAGEFPRPRPGTTLALGLVTGLALGVRIGGALILLYLLLLALLLAVRGALQHRGGRMGDLTAHAPRLAASLLAVGGVAWAAMLVCWPAALLRPVAIPLEALRAASQFQWVGPLLWNGREVWSNDLPWSYLPVLFAVQLPEVLVVLFAASLGWGALTCWPWRRGGPHPGAPAAALRPGLALLVLATLFPVGWAVAMGSTLYDNGRHFLFVLPPLACLAGLLWSRLVAAAAGRHAALGLALPLALLGALAPSTARMASLHPYEYAYLNAFAGGMPAGARRFDTEYWITSYREASRAVLDHAAAVAAASGTPLASLRFHVAVVGPQEVLAGELPENFTVVPADQESRADYLVATTRWRSDLWWPDWPEIAAVGRAGVRFAVVKAAPGLVRLVPPAPPRG